MQILLTGIATGVIYGFVGMGFSVTFYVTRVINFAQGQLLTVAIMVAAAAAAAGWPIAVAILVGIGAAVVVGVVVYLIAVRPVLAFDRFSFAWLVTTLGVAVALENGMAIIWGTESRPFPALLNNYSIHIGSATVTGQNVLAVCLAILLVTAFELLRRRTLFGKLSVAVALDPEMAAAVGGNTTFMAIAAFAIGALFAGIGGVLAGPTTFGNPYLGDTYGIDGFIALMIAGYDRPSSAMLGGVVLGIIEQLSIAYISPEAASWVPFLAVMVVLVFMPKGLFSVGNPLERVLRRLLHMVEAAP